jgi:putative tricarboxylic transport membrane protein
LGLVIGDFVDANFNSSLLIGRGSYLIFFTRPLSLSLFVLTVVMLLWPYLKFGSGAAKRDAGSTPA